MSEIAPLKSTGNYQDDLKSLGTILLSEGFIGKLTTQEQVDEAFNQLLEYEDTMFEKLLEFIDTETSYQDDLYQDADEIVGNTELIEDADDEFRMDITSCLDKSIADLSGSLETIYFQM